MTKKSKLQLRRTTVANLASLSPKEQGDVYGGTRLTDFLCKPPTGPITDSYAYKSCGPECGYILTQWCHMSYEC
jgi:hypothetical protein